MVACSGAVCVANDVVPICSYGMLPNIDWLTGAANCAPFTQRFMIDFFRGLAAGESEGEAQSEWKEEAGSESDSDSTE